MTLILHRGGLQGPKGQGNVARNRVFPELALQRADTDPISTPDYTITVADAQTTEDVSAVRLLVYRTSTGSLEGEVASGGPTAVVEDVGFYGAGQSGLTVVALKAGFRPQRVLDAQEPAGGSVNVGLIPDFVYQSGTVVGGGVVVLDTVAKTIQITAAIELRDLYSYLVDQWIASGTLPATVFPIVARSNTSYEIRGGWDFLDDTSRGFVRGGGWLVTNTSEELTAIYANVTTLGTIGAGEILRYQQVSQGTVNAFAAGHVDLALLVYSDPEGDGTPATDVRNYLRIIADTEGRTRDEVDVLTTLGIAELEADSYTVAISTADDSDNVTATDAQVDADAPYTSMSLVYEATTVSRTVGADTSDYFNTINGNASAAQIYTWFRRQQRKAGVVGSGAQAVNGWDTPSLLEYVGAELFSRRSSSRGTYVVGIDAADLSSVTLTDDDGDENAYPDFPTVTLTFSANLIGGQFRAWTKASFDAGTPVAVVDANGDDVHDDGTIPAGGVVSFLFDHSVDVEIVVQAIRKGVARFTQSIGTITATGAGLQLTGEDENSITYDAGDIVSATLDGPDREIQITDPGVGNSTSASARAHYGAYVNWAGDSPYTGLSYPPAFDISGGDTAGGSTTSPRFVLINSWQVVVVRSHKVVAGNGSLLADSGDPIAAVSGTPVIIENTIAVDAEVVEVDGIAADTRGWVKDIWQGEGFDPNNPRTITETRDEAGAVRRDRTVSDGGATITIERT